MKAIPFSLMLACLASAQEPPNPVLHTFPDGKTLRMVKKTEPALLPRMHIEQKPVPLPPAPTPAKPAPTALLPAPSLSPLATAQPQRQLTYRQYIEQDSLVRRWDTEHRRLRNLGIDFVGQGKLLMSDLPAWDERCHQTLVAAWGPRPPEPQRPQYKLPAFSDTDRIVRAIEEQTEAITCSGR